MTAVLIVAINSNHMINMKPSLDVGPSPAFTAVGTPVGGATPVPGAGVMGGSGSVIGVSGSVPTAGGSTTSMGTIETGVGVGGVGGGGVGLAVRLFSTVALVVVFLVMSAGDPVMTGVDQVNPVGAVGRVFSVMVQLNPVGIEFTVPVAPAAMVTLPVLLASLPVAGAHT